MPGPSSDCFAGYSHVARNAFFADAYAPADLAHEYTLKKSHQSVLAYGKWCSQIYAVNNTAKYASTVATAQDMLQSLLILPESFDVGKPDSSSHWSIVILTPG